ncbi:hypothetical protein [Allosalinactinospora lopnorensis]|uniref:hypothetical protein n=1 Tax=Allosalinactinospora lopnorensis TaxID=1352348 RepID=UPI0012E2114D|nr:hypothetical protein [Allosalinactinospora lopnorensis]
MVAALIMGPKARSRIRRSGGELEGENLVRIGTILAWVGIVLSILAVAWGAASFIIG